MFNFKICREGATRMVVLIGNYALKFPSLHSYPLFIEGIRANLQEGLFVGYDRSAPIAPTLYSNKFGIFNIQQRVRPVVNIGMFPLALHEMLASSSFFSADFLLNDLKPCNFGYATGNRLVKLDYGS